MKGILVNRLGGPDVLKYKELPDPVPGPDQVLIKVKGASVNFADIKARSGQYHLGRNPPFIPGIDVAGIVVATGSAVKDIKIGDRVVAFPSSGSYAEKTVANKNLTFVIPDSIPFETAAAFPIVAGTAMHMLTVAAGMKKRESLLIHAAGGGVGSTALQLAKTLNVSQIIASVGSPWKITKVNEIGADAVVDYTSGDYAKNVSALTDGEGVDVIVNPIGGMTIVQDLQCLAPFGRLVLFGKMSGEPVRIPPEILHKTNRTVIGFSFGHYRRYRPEMVRSTIKSVINLLENNRLEIIIGKCFPLKEASAAHRYIEERKALGKVILIPD